MNRNLSKDDGDNIFNERSFSGPMEYCPRLTIEKLTLIKEDFAKAIDIEDANAVDLEDMVPHFGEELKDPYDDSGQVYL